MEFYSTIRSNHIETNTSPKPEKMNDSFNNNDNVNDNINIQQTNSKNKKNKKTRNYQDVINDICYQLDLNLDDYYQFRKPITIPKKSKKKQLSKSISGDHTSTS